MSTEFHVTLLSNDSINFYPENVLSSFTNYMEVAITLFGEWEVGISELFYNKFSISPINDSSMIITENGRALITVESSETTTSGDFFYIHTDIIEPRRVGNQMVRCLKVLPAFGERYEYVKFGRIEYYPVQSSYIRSISIMILDSESKRIQFHESNLPTFITLHFRKKRI